MVSKLWDPAVVEMLITVWSVQKAHFCNGQQIWESPIGKRSELIDVPSHVSYLGSPNVRGQSPNSYFHAIQTTNLFFST